MFHFIESIRVEHGKTPLLDLHQNRMDRTLAHFGRTHGCPLKEAIVVPEIAREGVYKCRVTYTLDKVLDIEFIPYRVRKVNSISLVDIRDRTYTFKYRDRTWIKDLLSQSRTDEIIMHQDGLIKDASYANLAFFDGEKWITPRLPLLKGVRRHQLLLDQVINEEDIRREDLERCSRVRLINAMMTWEESPVVDLNVLT